MFYAVDVDAADACQVPSPGAAARLRRAIPLGDHVYRGPLWGVDPDGRVERIGRPRRP